MELELSENVPLHSFTTLGVGGSARYYTEARRLEQVLAAHAWAKERELPLLVLGGGSNLVVADAGHPGLVLHMALSGVEMRDEPDHVSVEAGAGEDWDRLVERTVQADLCGFECL